MLVTVLKLILDLIGYSLQHLARASALGMDMMILHLVRVSAVLCHIIATPWQIFLPF